MPITRAHRITDRKILAVLIAGFALVILLLAAAAVAGVANLQSIRASAGALVREQTVSTNLINEVQRQQGALSAILHRLAGDPDSLDREQMIAQLDQADAAIRQVASSGFETRELPLWQELERSATDFTAAARRSIAGESNSGRDTRTLVQLHENVIALIAKLIAASRQRASAEQSRINERSSELVQEARWLLGACIALALVCAVFTVRNATALFRKMEWQAGELSRVSWHMLERQETTARRFSHELHDELGQSLAAVKANLVKLDDGTDRKERKEDCLRLVEEAIGNVRELSQMLRPTILDDFGLDASLRWLADRFTQRTGIQVDYQSEFKGRLPDETETHLFRIAQEALTNVARHSGASHVEIRLKRLDGSIRLAISDDGRGLPELSGKHGLGLVGMRARARSAGGELSVTSHTVGGVQIEALIPAGMEESEIANSSAARR
jgi:signal transduction histidine kinase